MNEKFEKEINDIYNKVLESYKKDGLLFGETVDVTNVKELVAYAYVKSRSEIMLNADVVSLSPMPLTLSAKIPGETISYTWENFGDIKSISYRNLKILINNYRERSILYTDFIKEGYVYIKSKTIVENLGLEETYKNLLTKEEMETVIECNEETSLCLFSKAPKSQQLNMVNIIVNRLCNGERYFSVILHQMSMIVGVNIIEMVNEGKRLLELIKEG
jgi:hypothetical protein